MRVSDNTKDILNVFDDKDPTAAPEEVRRRAALDTHERMNIWDKASGSLKGLRIGVPQVCVLFIAINQLIEVAQEYFPVELSPVIHERVRDILSGLRSMGATVVPVSLPSTAYALGAYYVIASAEASSNMARYDGVEYGMLRVLICGNHHHP